MKHFAILFAVMLLLNGCATELSIHDEKPSAITTAASDELFLEAKEETVTPGGMEYSIVNQSKEVWEYGLFYLLQVKENGEWYNLNLTGGVEVNGKFGMEFPAIALVAKPGEEQSESVDWTYYYGELPGGHYRLIKEGQLCGADGNRPGESTCLAAEFTIPG